MVDLTDVGRKARAASVLMGILDSNAKNDILFAMADALEKNAEAIIYANSRDMEKARTAGRPDSILDRLLLDEKRICGMANGLRKVAALPDPVGEVIGGSKRPNGLSITKKRVPLGVIGIIYEARPNVTADAIGLCVKSGNCVILRGGSDAVESASAIADAMVEAGIRNGLPEDAVYLIRDVSRESSKALMELTGYLDVLIPRGGAGLIRSVVENAKVPVIETGTGNCHIYVDASADIEMAKNIAVNAKTSRPGVCNAAESLLIHRDIAERFLSAAVPALRKKGVELRGCPISAGFAGVKPATEEDYATEYLDLIMSVKVVGSVEEAIEHINRYGTKHSECIVTDSVESARLFQNTVDAAAVYVNASTRFTDGEEFGFGAEIGISTQKLHARGPMGLTELTTYKYILVGDGQIR